MYGRFGYSDFKEAAPGYGICIWMSRGMSAVRTLIAMSTQRSGAEAWDGQQHLFVFGR
ncbi:MAG TPA: hypothetical protein VNO32_23795 [Candidatus Acidoferrum sp.]|nr:hypothetical protein [Candidatus Acidoferrum sp.]